MVKGLDVRVFGEPMSFWEQQMPAGMLLRSPWAGSHLSDPDRALTLDAYRSASGNHLSAPLPLDRFIDYGRWFQRHVVSDLDKRAVARIDLDPKGFQLTLADGERLKSRRVVVATGIGSFAQRPPQFEHIPSTFVTHSSEHRDLSRIAAGKVCVIGAGQSALESAALLREAGAEVEVISRSPQIHWLNRSSKLHRLGLISKLFYSPTDVGPAGISRIVAAPGLVRCFPRGLQDYFRARSLRPAGSAWLRARFNDIKITTGRTVVSAVPSDDYLTLRLDDGGERRVNHVLLGTGYRVDISRYSFLARNLMSAVRCIHGHPRLDQGFEASLLGLHFLGAPAAWSFGPLLRFVAGSSYAASELTRFVSRDKVLWRVAQRPESLRDAAGAA
jgi:cation diffusion facilitator CzcD-associated flavoprotein CzcO